MNEYYKISVNKCIINQKIYFFNYNQNEFN